MAFFDGVKRNLTQAGQSAAQKAKDLSESASLSRGIAENEKEIKNLLLQLGTEFYERNAVQGVQGYEEFFDQINNLKYDNEMKQARYDELNAAVICPVCGDKLKADASFCSNCGCQLQTAEEMPGFCYNCGKQLPPGSAFCVYCGTRF